MGKGGKAVLAAAAWLVIIAAGYTACAPLFKSTPKTAQQLAAEKQRESLWRCEYETKARMADADGFEVEPHGQWLVDPADGPDAYTYQFRAKGRNAFGALVWADMTCRVAYQGGAWVVQDLQQR